MKKIKAISVEGEKVFLDSRHFVVLRLKEGEFVKALLPDGRFAVVEVIDAESKAGRICQIMDKHEKRWKISVGLSLLKRQHNETAVKFLSLIEVYRIIPIVSSRVEVKISAEKQEKFIRRLQSISAEGARISGAPPPQIDNITHIFRLNPESFDVRMVFWEKSSNYLSLDFLLKLREMKSGSILIVVGPEGGFDDSEIDFLKKMGFVDYSVGDLIITAEMFPLYIVSTLDFVLNGK